MVYVLQMGDTNFFKVGYTGRGAKIRVKELQTGSPRRLSVHAIIEGGDEALESQLHLRLALFRTDGGEDWFEIEAEQLDKILKGEKLDDEQWITGRYGTRSALERFYASDVRQISGRQQNPVTSGGEDVLHPRHAPIMYTGDQRVIFPQCQEFDLGGETDWWQTVREFGKRLVELRAN